MLPKNNIIFIYNFDLKQWQQQASLPLIDLTGLIYQGLIEFMSRIPCFNHDFYTYLFIKIASIISKKYFKYHITWHKHNYYFYHRPMG